MMKLTHTCTTQQKVYTHRSFQFPQFARLHFFLHLAPTCLTHPFFIHNQIPEAMVPLCWPSDASYRRESSWIIATSRQLPDML